MGIELTLTVQNDKRVKLQTREGGQGKQEPANLDKLTLSTIGVFQRWLVAGKVSERRELEVLGMHLYSVLFQGEIETYFRLQLDKVPKGERLRLQLTFDDDVNDLASLPWEYLYYPGTPVREGFFFATHVDLVLSRYMPLEADRESLAPDESPLRVLIAVSKPTDDTLGPVVAEPVIEAIQKLTERHPVKVDVLDKPTIDNFYEALQRFKPHVLHFIGHGRYYDKKGEIAMLDPDETSVSWVGDQQFADFFTYAQTIPRLVFLHLCEGGKVDFDANFAGVAPKLIRAKIQAVVAMQYPITNKAAIAFSRQFYRKLAEGKAVDDAVQEGRWMITMNDPQTYNSRIFGTPVLYMRSFDGIIQPIVESQQQTPSRPGKTETAATPVGSQETTAKADISKVVARMKSAAYAEAQLKSLDIAALASEIEGTDWGKDEAEVKQKIKRRILENESSQMVFVYTAMLRALEN
ncbi:MAG TPA: CHAT domain-containing protein [Planctomycetota bacterium]|nr:CHAT domain-containing protein [Planctomycetota bacterium]